MKPTGTEGRGRRPQHPDLHHGASHLRFPDRPWWRSDRGDWPQIPQEAPGQRADHKPRPSDILSR